jgi:hypothetical protein
MPKQITLDDIIDGKDISDSSKKLYKANFVRLNDGNPVTNFNFLFNVGNIKTKLEKYKPNTQRNYIIAIASLFHDLKETYPKKYAAVYDEYFKILTDYNKALKDQTEKTPVETKNWITEEQKAEVIENCEKIIAEIGNKKKVNEEQYNRLLDCVVLSLYTKIAPRRNLDFQMMKVVKAHDPAFGIETNFLDLSTKRFIFNRYKTKGAYKQQVVDIPDDLWKIISVYLKVKPKFETNDFLTTFAGEPFVQNNSITRILNKIFGQKIGVGMLRKMYLTNKYSEVLSDLKQDATSMGTSVEVAKNNYIKDLK